MSYSYYMDNFITQSEKAVDKNIKKLVPIRYNKFYWWRNFSPKVKPLMKHFPFKDKVLNGDYELSEYYWMAQHAVYEGMKKVNLKKDDTGTQIEKLALDRAKYKRLMADFQKEEDNRLKGFLEELLKEFFIEKEQLDEELLRFDGLAKEFYLYLEKKYDKRKRKTRKPREKKYGKN
jgi:hypothetical protein